MTLYRIEIDRSTCVGYGGCVREAPDVFWIEDGLAYAEDVDGRRPARWRRRSSAPSARSRSFRWRATRSPRRL